jgi:hypothetical protein
MSINSLAGTYSITNRQAQLDLYLSDNRESIIGENVGPQDFRTWIFEPVDDVHNGYLIKSKVDGLYIGFRGYPSPGTKLVAGDRDMAKVWSITKESLYEDEPSFVIRHANPEAPFVVEFPRDNLQPGTPAQLGLTPFVIPMPANQTWIIKKLGN